MKRYYSILILLFLIFSISNIYCDLILDNYIKKGDFDNAIKYCEKQKGENQIKSFNTLADAYFSIKKYDNSAVYYEKAGNKDGLKKVAEIHLGNKDYDKAIVLYIEAGVNEKEAYILSANYYLQKGLDQIALEIYIKSGIDEKSAFLKIADFFAAVAIDLLNKVDQFKKLLEEGFTGVEIEGLGGNRIDIGIKGKKTRDLGEYKQWEDRILSVIIENGVIEAKQYDFKLLSDQYLKGSYSNFLKAANFYKKVSDTEKSRKYLDKAIELKTKYKID